MLRLLNLLKNNTLSLKLIKNLINNVISEEIKLK